MLVREVKENRAELSILVQSEAGTKGEIVQDVPPERMLTRFPYVLDTTGNARPRRSSTSRGSQFGSSLSKLVRAVTMT